MIGQIESTLERVVERGEVRELLDVAVFAELWWFGFP